MKLNQLKLGARLGFGFGTVLMLAAFMALIGYWRLEQTLNEVQANRATQERATAALRWEALTLLNVNRTLAIAESGGNNDVKAHFLPLIKDTSAQISAIQKELEAGLSAGEEKTQFEDIAARRHTYVTARDSIFSFLEMEDPGAKEALNSHLLPAATRYLTAINGYQTSQRKLTDDHAIETQHHVKRAEWLLLMLALASLAICAVFAWQITQSVTSPLRHAADTTRTIAAGDLSQNARAEGNDEVTEVLRGLNEMQVSLRGIVGDVRSSTDSIKVASDEVAIGSADLSR
ncbi:MAG: HAMP domain-containing protein, partial [Pseudomonadota bacterium]